jgi:hypothetical protein
MSGRNLELFLARVYVDPELRARFRANPSAVAATAGLSTEECIALEKTDWTGLEMASRSFHKKRELKNSATKSGARRFAIARYIATLVRRFLQFSRS